MNFTYMLKDLVYCRGNLNKWIDNRLRSLDLRGYVTVPKEDFKVFGTPDALYYTDILDFSILEEVATEYNYTGIRSDDIVLDIGANTGLFSLKIKNQVQKVYSVEPIFINELQRHIALNQADDKIKILPYALSNSDIVECSFGKTATVPGKSLTELKEMCGGHVDFLKCDCEGGEWSIKPEELDGIRRIEIEVHSFNGENLQDFVSMLDSCGYDCTVDPRNDHTNLVHAFRTN